MKPIVGLNSKKIPTIMLLFRKRHCLFESQSINPESIPKKSKLNRARRKRIVSETKYNACNKCSIDQACCSNLSGLRVSEKEYRQLFAKHIDKIEVEQSGRIYSISGKNGSSCPNWVNKQCAVYVDRPMECSLFPYTIGRIVHKGNRVNITYHSRTRCPEKKVLLISKAEANKMLFAFAESAFSDAEIIKIEYEWLFTRLKNKITSFITIR